MKRVLITDDVHPLLLDGLRQRAYDPQYLPDISFEECSKIIHWYEGLVINSKILVDRQFLDRAGQLKWIARLGSGLEIIDLQACSEKGIYVFNTPEGNCQAVAEHALAMLLGLLRNIPRANSQVKSMIWHREANRGVELSGKTVGIIGFGYTGSSFAKVLEGLNVKVLVFDKYKQLSSENKRYEVVKDVHQLQKEADIISIHLPLTSETLFYIDQGFIDACKPGFILINTSRGKICKTQDLLQALQGGKVSGACLDVFENEKPHSYSQEEQKIYKKLMALENLIVSPHIAGWTIESKEKIAQYVLQKLDLKKS